MRRLAVLMSTDANDPQELSSIQVVVSTLANFGWTAGKNLEIRYWWGAGDTDRMMANALEAIVYTPTAATSPMVAISTARPSGDYFTLEPTARVT